MSELQLDPQINEDVVDSAIDNDENVKYKSMNVDEDLNSNEIKTENSNVNNTENLQNKKDDTPTAVCFVIHGMGAQPNYVRNVNSFRIHCQESLTGILDNTKDKLEIVAIEWHTDLHELETTDTRMSSISLSTALKFRSITNNILADVLYYFSAYHGKLIIDMIGNKLNKAYLEFMKKYPRFNGRITLLGHSLGGIILYDILSHNRTNFNDNTNLNKNKNTKRSRSTSPKRSRDGRKPINNINNYNARTGRKRRSSVDLTLNREKLSSTSNDSKSLPHSISTNSFLKSNPSEILNENPFMTHWSFEYPILKFKPDFLMLIGSPLGAVLVMRGQNPSTYRPDNDILVHNVFHTHDPFGYRLEPLSDSEYSKVSPVILHDPEVSKNKGTSWNLYGGFGSDTNISTNDNINVGTLDESPVSLSSTNNNNSIIVETKSTKNVTNFFFDYRNNGIAEDEVNSGSTIAKMGQRLVQSIPNLVDLSFVISTTTTTTTTKQTTEEPVINKLQDRENSSTDNDKRKKTTETTSVKTTTTAAGSATSKNDNNSSSSTMTATMANPIKILSNSYTNSFEWPWSFFKFMYLFGGIGQESEPPSLPNSNNSLNSDNTNLTITEIPLKSSEPALRRSKRRRLVHVPSDFKSDNDNELSINDSEKINQAELINDKMDIINDEDNESLTSRFNLFVKTKKNQFVNKLYGNVDENNNPEDNLNNNTNDSSEEIKTKNKENIQKVNSINISKDAKFSDNELYDDEKEEKEAQKKSNLESQNKNDSNSEVILETVRRIDFCVEPIPTSFQWFEKTATFHEYLQAVRAHFSYWRNRPIALHFISVIFGGDLDEARSAPLLGSTRNPRWKV